MKNKIMDHDTIRRAISRMAHEILEKSASSPIVTRRDLAISPEANGGGGMQDLALIGIRTRGVTLAERLKQAIKDIEKIEVPMGILDITLYRDDLTSVGAKPVVRQTLIDFDITDKRIVLVDDVFYTGRTIRAAFDALNDFGRPAKIELAVLVDRGHRELPIRADFVGKNVPTGKNQNIEVIFGEAGKPDEVVLEEN